MNYKFITIDGKQISEHRYVMQCHLGRKLLKTEIVHHKDRNRRNNILDNLVLTNQSEHIKEHHRNNELHKVGYNDGIKSRNKYGKKVLVKDLKGNELFISFSIKCAAKDTNIPLMTLWRILNGITKQRNDFIVEFYAA